MTRRGSEATVVTELRHIFDPLVRGVLSASQYVVQSSNNIYQLARHGKTAATTTSSISRRDSSGWRQEFEAQNTLQDIHTPEQHTRVNEQAEHVQNRQRKLSRAQEAASRQRMEVLQHRHGVMDSLRFVDDTVEDLVRLLLAAFPERSPPKQLDSLLARLKDDQVNLRAQVSAWDKHDLALLDLDHALDMRGRNFADSARAFLSTAGLQPVQTQRSAPTSPASSRCRSLSPAPSLLARFLDRRGDIGVFRERLGGLELQHAELSAQREILKDRGDRVSTPDDEFDMAYQLEREEILRDLQSAVDDTDQLELACQQNNIDTSLMHRQPSEVSEAESEQYLPLGEPFVLIPRLDNAQVKSSVSDWMQQVHFPPDDGNVATDMDSLSLRRLEEADPKRTRQVSNA